MDLLQNEPTGVQNSKCVQQQIEMKIMSIFPSVSPEEDSQEQARVPTFTNKNKEQQKTLKITEESTVNVKTKQCE